MSRDSRSAQAAPRAIIVGRRSTQKIGRINWKAAELTFGATQTAATIRLVNAATAQKLRAASRRCRLDTSRRAAITEKHGIASTIAIQRHTAGSASRPATAATASMRFPIVNCPRGRPMMEISRSIPVSPSVRDRPSLPARGSLRHPDRRREQELYEIVADRVIEQKGAHRDLPESSCNDERQYGRSGSRSSGPARSGCTRSPYRRAVAGSLRGPWR